ncbi:GyrI-like domain-containing protein [Lacinutrix sp. C3R15]|uniref:GyrI-like domain-containing protein n=1 Tax=Flavobacteriaceae TaxID=49546 RepID=UPI001C09BFB3|nr:MULTISPECIES: GyrI-like domain-containing protein [Flavobacteriaceae]MBU2940652.1 GyrI-like domain-containing protein [Lacinutrix sp. C3R15]MDO6623970.1 GyrI-like domain-containing protein [Oceanihabitans sp. 1_MG-2023]
MQPRIESVSEKKLVGQSVEMSLINNKTFKLFSSFMPNRKQVQNSLGNAIYEVMLYDAEYFKNFAPNNMFTKWATIEVKNVENIPEGMQSISLKSGLYAVFTYKGLAKDFSNLMQYVFTEWLPKSEYTLDNRPHFNILGNKYIQDSPESEEDVYIPIQRK